jgi:hypothetical protein
MGFLFFVIFVFYQPFFMTNGFTLNPEKKLGQVVGKTHADFHRFNADFIDFKRFAKTLCSQRV